MASNSSKPVIGLSLGLHDFGDYAGVGHQRPLALAGGVGFMLPRVNGPLAAVPPPRGRPPHRPEPLRTRPDRASGEDRSAPRRVRAGADRAGPRSRPSDP